MRWITKTVVGLAALSLCALAQAATVQGRLELQWSDPAQGRGAAEFRATLVRDDGDRLDLDPAQALRAAENLYALAGRRIAVELSPMLEGGTAPRIEAIVAADRAGMQAVGGAPPVSGTTTWVTLMCGFSDVAWYPPQYDLGFFQSQYGNGPGQLGHYWRAASYDKIDLTGSSAHGWFVLPHPAAYYMASGTPLNGGPHLQKLVEDCTAAADADVDFSANGSVYGINLVFNGEIGGKATGGQFCMTLDGIDKCWKTTWLPPWGWGLLAALVHEMGHGYGLAHADNSDGDTDSYDNPWDVMSGLWHNTAWDDVYGDLPKHLSMYSRDTLGWVDPARKRTIMADTRITGIQLDHAGLVGSSQAQMIEVRVPGEPDSSYYTIESRQRSDLYDSKLAGNAVIIQRVVAIPSLPTRGYARSVDADMPPATLSNNEGSMFKAGETWTAPDGAFRVRVHAENADGFVVSVCGARNAGNVKRLMACAERVAARSADRNRLPAAVTSKPVDTWAGRASGPSKQGVRRTHPD